MVSNHEYKRVCSELDAAVKEVGRLKELLEAYVHEFRLCRFCKNIKGDCSPTDKSCKPKWGGL